MSARVMMALALVLASAPLAASRLGEFHDGVADAYRFYRGATFYLRTGNAMVAGFELEQMRTEWNEVIASFGDKPPDAYSDQSDFSEQLTSIGARIDEAYEATSKGDSEAAAKALSPIRGMLSSLRARAGVRVFSDEVNELNDAVAALYVYRHQRPDLDDPATVNDIKAKAAVVLYLLERCDRSVDPAIARDEEFRRLIDGMRRGSTVMFEALDARDTTRVINIIREMRSFDRMLFLRFG